MTSFSIIAVLVLPAFAWVWARHWLRHGSLAGDQRCSPPPTFPQLDPFFGIDLVRRFFKTTQEHRRMQTIRLDHAKYGHTFQSFPFGRRVISTVAPENLQAIWGTQFACFGIGPLREKAQGPLTGAGLFTSDGEIWETGRALIKPTFTKDQIADHVGFERFVQRFLNLLPRDGQTVDLGPLFGRLSLDAGSAFIFGESIDALLTETPVDSVRFLRNVEYGKVGVGKRHFAGRMSFLIRDPKFWQSCAEVREYTSRHIDRALAKRTKASSNSRERGNASSSRHVLVEELAELTKDREVLIDQILNVFFAAHDTPGVLLTTLFWAIARHPRVWKKIREEVGRSQPEELTFEALKNLKYLQHTIKETFRMWPILANNSRICLKDTVLPTGGGAENDRPVAVRTGDTISVNFYTLYRDPRIFGEEPDEFHPERWEHIRPKWAFLPFGGGLRTCPAQQLSLFWVTYTTARLATLVTDVVNRDPVEEWVENVKLTMGSFHGAQVSLVFGPSA